MTESAKSVPAEDVKMRVRAALERKQAQAKSRENHQDGSSKVNNVHGPAAGKREFRRKSG